MSTHAKFQELPITAIAPNGWLRGYLQKQARGLTGHLHVAGFPFNTKGWAGPRIIPPKDADAWWPYEQYAYWIDALIRCGHLLGQKSLINKAVKNFDYLLNSADPDGYLGPKFLKTPGQCQRWPHAGRRPGDHPVRWQTRAVPDALGHSQRIRPAHAARRVGRPSSAAGLGGPGRALGL